MAHTLNKYSHQQGNRGFSSIIGLGAGPAGPVLAKPLFGEVMKFITDIFKNCVPTSCAPITARPLQKSFLCQ